MCFLGIYSEDCCNAAVFLQMKLPQHNIGPQLKFQKSRVSANLLTIECFLSLFLPQPQANRWGGEAREKLLSLGRGPLLWALGTQSPCHCPCFPCSYNQSLSFPHICPLHCMSRALSSQLLPCLAFPYRNSTRQSPDPQRPGYTPNSWVWPRSPPEA